MGNYPDAQAARHGFGAGHKAEPVVGFVQCLYNLPSEML